MGNFSRDNTFDRLKHYVSVRLQQGVPIVDADWNELQDVRKFELETFLKWFVGDGVPAGNDGFAVAAAAADNDVSIADGRCLVEGWEAVNDWAEQHGNVPLRYTTQPLFGDDALATQWGVAILPPLTTPGAQRADTVYLDVWEREVGSAEDGGIVNPLIGVETCVRTKREWVVRVAEGVAVPAPAPGHVHYPLATLNRAAGVAAVDDIVDLRRTGLSLASLEAGKVDRSGDQVQGDLVVDGQLGIGVTQPETRLHVSGGNWDVAATEGDFKIGAGVNGLKVGVGVTGAEAGQARLRASGSLLLGAGAADVLTVWSDRVTIAGSANPNLDVTATGTAITADAVSDTGLAKYGVQATASGSAGTKYGLYGAASGDDTSYKYGVYGLSSGNAGNRYGVFGSASGDGGVKYGLFGTATGAGTKYGVRAYLSEHDSDTKYGGHAYSHGDGGTKYGWYGQASGTGGTKYGVYGYADGDDADSKYGFYGKATGTGGLKYGVYGSASANDTSTKYGLFGAASGADGTKYGVYSTASGDDTGDKVAVRGYANGTKGIKYGINVLANGAGTNYGIYANANGGSTNWAGYFSGNVHINGTLSKTGGSFLIDHVLDPENKVLRHSFVESPEDLCLYRGKVTLSPSGTAGVDMPAYFAALTREEEATVLLTPIGEKPGLFSYTWQNEHTRLAIHGEPGTEVSYLVLANRDDPVIRLLRKPVEEDKETAGFEKGKLLNPAAYGRPEELDEEPPEDVEEPSEQTGDDEQRAAEEAEKQKAAEAELEELGKSREAAAAVEQEMILRIKTKAEKGKKKTS